jgi:MFS family permease
LLQQTGMGPGGYALTVTLFSIAYTLFEVPSNYVMKHWVRPSVWLGVLLAGWGVLTIGYVATFWTVVLLLVVVVEKSWVRWDEIRDAMLTWIRFAGVQNFATVVVLRFLIGVFEAGFFPGEIISPGRCCEGKETVLTRAGIVYLITIWYRHDERAVRIALVIAFCNLAGAFGGAIAYGVGHINGAGGLEGFRWLFIIEVGCPLFLLAGHLPADQTDHDRTKH